MKNIYIFLLLCLSQVVSANTITVQNSNDTGTGSLREAILNASDNDTIRFSSTTNTNVIYLTSGQILLEKDLVIVGNDSTKTIIDGSGSSRIFEIAFNTEIYISQLKIQNGHVNKGSPSFPEYGGGIISSGTLTIDKVLFFKNSTNETIPPYHSGGGAIYNNEGELIIKNSTISHNSSKGISANGGGILSAGGSILIVQSKISENSIEGTFNFGAGLLTSKSAVTISRSIFSGNSVADGSIGFGGGLFIFEGSLNMSNSIVSGNHLEGLGAGMHTNYATVVIANSTISGNVCKSEASKGGGIYYEENGTGSMRLYNTIIAKNSAAINPNYFGPLSSFNQNNIIGTDPLFIADVPAAPSTGGDLHLSKCSAAINTGETNPLFQINHGSLDFDGNPRIHGNVIDIGAYETNDFQLTKPHIVSTNNDFGCGSLRFLTTFAAAGDTIYFAPETNGKLTNLTNGQIKIDKDLVIMGNGPDKSILDANAEDRIFEISPNINVYLDGLKSQNGKVDDYTHRFKLSGGGIYNAGNLTLSNSSLSNNSATSSFDNPEGGGIFNAGNLKLVNTSVSNNKATSNSGISYGGGIYNNNSLTIENSNILNNSISSKGQNCKGAGICHFGGKPLIITSSRISGNSLTAQAAFALASSSGGGVYLHAGNSIFKSSIISGNKITYNGICSGGGAYINSGKLDLINCTVTGNKVENTKLPEVAFEGGISNKTDAVVNLKNVIISKNHAPNNENIDESDLGENINSLIGVDVDFIEEVPAAPSSGGDLQLNINSPGIDAGSNDTTGIGIYDVAGLPRFRGTKVDIGAYEYFPLYENHVFYVINTNTSGEGSLTYAVDNISEGDTIKFGEWLNGNKINVNFEIFIDKSMTIKGNGSEKTIIDGNASDLIFLMNSEVSVTIQDLTIQNGNGGQGGCIYAENAYLHLKNVNLINNITRSDGGAIYSISGGSSYSALILDQVRVSGNSAVNGSYGGIYAFNKVIIRNSIISGNYASENIGGIGVGSDNVSIINTTITGNKSELEGGGLANYNNTVSLVNSIISQNFDDGTAPDILKNGGSYINVGYNLIGSSLGGHGILHGNNNTLIAAPPQFLAAVPEAPTTAGNLHLQPCSPAINAGIADTTGLYIGEFDFEANTRVFDGRIDIGAYERQSINTYIPLLVTNTYDDGCGSLRMAILKASAGDTIRFEALIDKDTIKLTTGQIVIDKKLFIKGNGQENTLIDGQTQDRIFEISASGSLGLVGLTLQNGDVSGEANGGAIYSQGNLAIEQSSFRNNKGNSGGAIASPDFATLDIFISNSTFSFNEATQNGGAIKFWGDTLGISNSTFNSNSATTDGGAIRTSNNSGNTIIIDNSTFSANTADNRGGAIRDNSSLIQLSNSTFYNNTASSGGGLYIYNTNLEIQNNLFKNTGTSEVDDILKASGSAIVNKGTNLIYSSDGDHGISDGNGIDPLLGPLSDNGGFTKTHALLCGSPAFNNGTGSFPDQRGKPVYGNQKDIGSYEAQKHLSGGANLLVTNTNDKDIGSLRFTISQACPTDTLRFDPSNNHETIILTTGQILIDKDITIIGNGITNTLIDGNDSSRIFEVTKPNSLNLKYLRLQNGYSASAGGAIYARGSLDLNQIEIHDSEASTGGAIAAFQSGDSSATKIMNSTFSNNSAIASGGAIAAKFGYFEIENSTIDHNQANFGGGLYLSNCLTNSSINNSTISSNTGAEGGAINFCTSGNFKISNTTIVSNTGTTGGGIYASTESSSTSLSISNTILKNTGTYSPDIAITGSVLLQDNGYNLVFHGSGHSISDGNGIDPLLGPLSDNGGFTKTHALLCDSPAYNAGFGTGKDQRDFSIVGIKDIGAFESQIPELNLPNRRLAEFNETYTCENASLKLAAGLTNSDFTYLWQVNSGSGFKPISEATPYSQTVKDSLIIDPISLAMEGYQFRALITNACKTIVSDTTSLIIGEKPSFITHPQSAVVCPGNELRLISEVSAMGFSYQWQMNEGSGFIDINKTGYSGTNSSELIISSFDYSKNNNQYRVLAKSSCFEVPSNAATITVNSDVTILAQPTAQTVCEFNTAQFIAQVVKLTPGTLNYQWQILSNGTWKDINTGGHYMVNDSLLIIQNTPSSWNGSNFRCLINDYCQTIPKTLHVIPVAHFTSNPKSLEICEGNNAVFTVKAAGIDLSYRWQVNTGSGFVNLTDGSVYQGVLSSNLSLLYPTANMNTYQYRCLVNGGSTCDIKADTSDTASLSIGTSAEAQTILYNSDITTDMGSTQAVGYILGINNIKQPNGKAEYRAGNSILLNPGFEVESGAVFKALIKNPCETNSVSTVYKTIPKELVK